MTKKDDRRPVLTVMPDYGFGPFLWINREPLSRQGVGTNCCSANSACGEHPLSAELLNDLTLWVMNFERAPTRNTIEDPFQVDVKWNSFHERGLELAKRLKAEVGESWRVIYKKPLEDPAHHMSERMEVMLDGEVRSW